MGGAVMVAAVVVACIGAGSVSPAAAEANEPVPLLELVAPSGTGRLYTLSRTEAARAVSEYGMQLQPPRTGYLRAQPFADSVALYRLNAKDGPWLVTASASERDSLVSSGRFVYEGVLGYTHRTAKPGTARLWRYSKPGEWRVAFDSSGPTLVKAGYKVDGSLGYADVGPSQPPPPAADRDGDGSAPPADCRDNNATVFPGAPEIPGNGIDDDCAGGDAPALIAASVKHAWRVTRAGARVLRLRVADAPKGATVRGPLPRQALPLQPTEGEGPGQRHARPAPTRAPPPHARRHHARGAHPRPALDREGDPLQGQARAGPGRAQAVPAAGREEAGAVLLGGRAKFVEGGSAWTRQFVRRLRVLAFPTSPGVGRDA